MKRRRQMRTASSRGMTKIAHISDLHLLEDGWKERTGTSWLRLGFCSLLRPRDPEARRERLRRALRNARDVRPDHVLITGDFTEDGADAQFRVLADVLRESDIPAANVTLVPGNHDAYTDGRAYVRALAGPLREWAATSAPGAVTRLGDAAIVALSTAVPQHFTRSIGSIGGAQLAALQRFVTSPRLSRHTLVAAQHHPPLGLKLPPVQWIDGLREHVALRSMLRDCSRLNVLHGHTHRATSRLLSPDRAAQIFSVEAVVESETALRVYWAQGGELWPLAETADAAQAPAAA